MKPTMNAIDIVVSDLEAAMAFYRLLGLDFQVDAYTPEHAQCDLPSGMQLMLDTEKLTKMARPGWTRAVGGPATFVCLELPTPGDVDTTYAHVTSAGHSGLREPWDAPWGMRYATVLDPDGNGVDLYASLPAA